MSLCVSIITVFTDCPVNMSLPGRALLPVHSLLPLYSCNHLTVEGALRVLQYYIIFIIIVSVVTRQDSLIEGTPCGVLGSVQSDILFSFEMFVYPKILLEVKISKP